MSINIKKDASSFLLFSDALDLDNSISSDWFEVDYWRQKNRIMGESKGRHTTWFIDPPDILSDQHWVLRHYYRGGLAAKFITDCYLYVGLHDTRPYLEVSLLINMEAMGLPAPKVIGARLQKKGLFYTADLLMERIPGLNLATLLKEQPLSPKHWHQVGANIAKFHAKGIYHADLNAHNILIEKNRTEEQTMKTWLIDFDRCEQRSLGKKNKKKYSWQNKNLARLNRSLTKEKTLFPAFNFDDNAWCSLIRGYRTFENLYP